MVEARNVDDDVNVNDANTADVEVDVSKDERDVEVQTGGLDVDVEREEGESDGALAPEEEGNGGEA